MVEAWQVSWVAAAHFLLMARPLGQCESQFPSSGKILLHPSARNGIQGLPKSLIHHG
jgi:hypothetical protein